MRSRRTAHDEVTAVARRRLELLSAELAGVRASMQADGQAEPPSSPSLDPAVARSVVPGEASTAPPSLATGSAAAPEMRAEVRPGRHARRPVPGMARAGAWLHDRLPATLQGRVALSSAHLSVVALLVAGAFGVSAWWVMRADGGETLTPSALSETAAAPAGGLKADPAGAMQGTTASPAASPTGLPGQGPSAGTQVVVDVAGKVRRPGIVTLPLGSRVTDALEAAGGARRGVDLTPLNLARLLVDGEQIVVGVAPPAGVAAAAASSPGAPPGGRLVNINRAGQAELEELPGVGPVTAAAILQWRTENGAFTAVDELMEVSGIGEATLAEMAPFVTL